MQFLLSICPKIFQSATHYNPVTSTNHTLPLVPSVPFSISPTPTNIH
jgi:hypothetical protein